MPARWTWRRFMGESGSGHAGLAGVPRGGCVGPGRASAEAILLDGVKNGVSFDWSLARGAAEKVIVAGGLDASNVAEAIRIAEPWGVDASSKLETRAGDQGSR